MIIIHGRGKAPVPWGVPHEVCCSYSMPGLDGVEAERSADDCLRYTELVAPSLI